MYGGVSQVDTFDPKPELTKHNGKPIPNLDSDPLLKVRNPGTLLGSTRKFAKHGQAGIEVSDLYPHLAGCVDDIAVIRGIYADSFAHGSGLLQMNTGFLRQGYPEPRLVGDLRAGHGQPRTCRASSSCSTSAAGRSPGRPTGATASCRPTYQGTQFRISGDPILNLSPPAGVSAAQQRNQLDLLGQLNERHRRATPDDTELAARIASYELAFRMQAARPGGGRSGERDGGDASGSTAWTTRRPSGSAGAACWPGGWSSAASASCRSTPAAATTTRTGTPTATSTRTTSCTAARPTSRSRRCLTDLKQRGLARRDAGGLDRASSAGRRPARTARAATTARAASPPGWPAAASRAARRIGATDDFGYAAVENKVHVHDLHATILHLLGLDHTLLTYFHGGRDMRLTDVSGRVVREVIA